MVKNLKELQKEEAIKRLEILTNKFDLKSNILEDFKMDKISLSINKYLTILENNSAFRDIIDIHEQQNNSLAYYGIVFKAFDMLMFAILTISPNIEDWEKEKELLNKYENFICLSGYAYNLDILNKCTEFVNMVITSEDGALIFEDGLVKLPIIQDIKKNMDKENI